MNNAQKLNAFNVWTHHMAKELNEDGAGVSVNLLDLQRDNMEDYKNLSVEQKTVFIAELTEEREIWTTGQQPTQHGCTQDINNVCSKIENLCLGLKHRTGVEFFYCLVRNMEEFKMAPCWYFSLKELDEFLQGAIQKGWDPEKISVMAEAFAVTGCNFMNQFVNPSELSNSIGLLQQLLAAIERGACHFDCFSPVMLAEQQKKHDESVAAGLMTMRKKHKDTETKKGKKKAAPATTDENMPVGGNEAGEEIAEHPLKHHGSERIAERV
ncbi:hypothetical protein A0H81_09521 [Grifola frondosa]|uniref:Uncharacterized protein n=1 Tax=Grifola frondosa TaxID=5627 RepID=A0A1C7M333_GRIFR|nr:hypothetical protein A0H81_09521 [Grifola frondosa]